MNHLREVLESLPDSIFRNLDINIEDSRLAIKFTQLRSEASQCFWLGDLGEISKLEVIPEMVRLPFKTVWFEGKANGVLVGILAHENRDFSVELLAFARRQNQWDMLCGVIGLNMEHATCEVFPDLPNAVKSAHGCTYALRAFCSAMNCTNVGLKKHEVDPKLQKARAKRGKAPLFSYWTLTLNGRGGESRDLGGTHAGPRVHLRRGHPRQYEPGKWTWVQAHAVGNKAHGVVHKDYRAGPGLVGRGAAGEPHV